MGANAVTTFPTYTTGQVLEAADLNITNCGVPVFAGTVERDAAFGGTGEKVLAEGQLCYLESTNVVQYYDGSSWATVGPTTGSPLVFISTASFTGVSTVSMPSSTFTSTYRNYLVILRVTASAGDQQLTMRVNNAGTPRTTGNYTGASVRAYSSVAVTNSAAATSFNLCAVSNSAPDTAVSLSITVYDPTSTSFKTNWGYTGFGGNDSNQPSAIWGGGLNTAAAEDNDGLTFIGAGPSNITGSYIVYGIRDS